MILREIREKIKSGDLKNTQQVVDLYHSLIGNVSNSGWALTANDGVAHRQDFIEFKKGNVIKFDSWYIDPDTGLWLDGAITVEFGSDNHDTMITATKRYLIEGNSIGDIGRAVEAIEAEHHNLKIIRCLSGHGIGEAIHKFPRVYNYADGPDAEVSISEGMRLAIEPLCMQDGAEFLDDTWSVSQGVATHYEATIQIINGKPVVLYGDVLQSEIDD